MSVSLPLKYREMAGGAEGAARLRTVLSEKDGGNPLDIYIYRIERMVYQQQSAFQQITIADTHNFGRVLMLDGALQSAQSDEALYHEMLIQPAMLCHPDPRDVLIIGGGEGASLREVLAHRSVRTATMVDIDGEVVEACRKYLPNWHCGAFDDRRARVLYADGRKFIEQDEAQYDVVIIDVVDMLDNGPAQALYTKQFYQALRRRLRPGFVVAIQGLEFGLNNVHEHAALVRTLRSVFTYAHSYSTTIPSFLSGWGFVVASNDYPARHWNPRDIDAAIGKKLPQGWLAHLDGAYLERTFSHCLAARRLLALPGPILEDGVDLAFDPGGESAADMVCATKARFQPLR